MIAGVLLVAVFAAFAVCLAMPVQARGLYLAPCSREAALWAVRAYHYSRTLPAGRLVCVGVWENGRFIGAVIFGRGASSEIASPFGLQQSEICELCRVALGPHVTPTSRILALAVKLLRKQSPNLRLIISFADPMQRGPSGQPHDGTIYRACGWWFIGMTNAESLIRLKGRLFHPRTISSRYKTRSIDWLRAHVAADTAHVRTIPKFRYALPLDAAMREQLAPRVQPYPKALVVERDRGADSGIRRAPSGVPSPFLSGESTCEGLAHVQAGRSIVNEAACLS